MKKTILFCLLEQYADWEAAYLSTALAAFGGEKYEIKTVSLTKESVKSIGGLTTVPDFDINSIPANYEALILIGGMTWRGEEAKQVKSIAMQCFNDGKVIGGICDASAYLGTIGILNSVKHTSNDLQGLKQWAGNSYTGEKNYVLEQAVSDNNVVTANGTATLEFAKEMLRTLNISSEENIEEWYNYHKLGMYKAPIPKVFQ